MKIGQMLASKGRFGDTMLAHISPEEADLLKAHGGSGTINPETGLPEFWKFKNFWKSLRDTGETAAVLAGNYYLPGSSMLTSKLTSDGSQKQLNSGIGKVAQIGTGLAGAGVGSSTTGIPSASDVGGGWTNTANNLGGFVGAPTIGTDIANGVSGLYDSASSGIGNLLSGAGKAVGLSGEGGLFGGGTAASLGAGAVDMQAPSSVGASFMRDSGLSSAIGAGAGGGSSSYGGLPTIGALLGGANSYMANEDAQKKLEEAQRNALGVLEPYNASGAAANSKLSDLLGTSGTPMSSADILAASPQYQFQLDQGNQALDRQQAAKGGYFSGAALKEAQTFGQGLANQTAQQYQDNLARQAGQGLNAAGGAANAYTSLGDSKANATIANSGIFNQTLSSLLGSGARKPIYSASGQLIGYQ